MPDIYVTYRSGDSSSDEAKLFIESLRETFKNDKITLTDAKQNADILAIQDKVREHDVLIVLIGKRFTHIVDENKHPVLWDPYDYLHAEISIALESHQQMRVLCVLTDDTKMPARSFFPDNLKALQAKQRFPVHRIKHIPQAVKHIKKWLENPNYDPYRSRNWNPQLIAAFVIAFVVIIFSLYRSSQNNSPSDSVTEATQTASQTPAQAVTRVATQAPAHNPALDRNQMIDDYGVSMVFVPAGCFMMGSNNRYEEQPVHEVCIEEAFWIDRYEVTNEQFEALDGEAGHEPDWDNPLQPRTSVTWFEALEFCRLRGGSLPTEAQWEYAARGANSLTYPWGDDLALEIAVITGINGEPSIVGSRPAGISWVGAYDLSGNVSEWVSSAYQDYPYNANDGREDLSNQSVSRVVRGRSHPDNLSFLRSSSRNNRFNPNYAEQVNGFRCITVAGRAQSEMGEQLLSSMTEIRPTITPSALPVVNSTEAVLDGNQMLDESGTVMLLVPAGCFRIGSDDGNNDELNGNELCLESFWIDKYEVSNIQYGSTGCDYWSSEPGQPRNCVSWYDAKAHCEARHARLPSEAEWEFAARGSDNLIYPPGNQYDSENIIGGDNSIYGNSSTAPVGSRPDGASWIGAMDMSGNLWEWTNSIYRDYPYDASDGREDDVRGRDIFRVVRGGSFDSNLSSLRSTNRNDANPHAEFFNFGFRCARSSDAQSETANVTELSPTQKPPTITPVPSATFSPVNHDPTLPENQILDESGTVMVRVPAGCFRIGSDDGDSDELNGNEVCLASFWIDKYEVSNERYGSRGCENWSSEPGQPRNCVNWFDAVEYCESRQARLPSEAEWEYAARGPDNLIYPWGNDWNPDYANWADTSSLEETFIIGSFPEGASWVGALDMSGNVSEWTHSFYDDYPYDASDGREGDTEERTDTRRVFRGGSFYNSSYDLRVSIRSSSYPENNNISIGFRCVRSIDE